MLFSQQLILLNAVYEDKDALFEQMSQMAFDEGKINATHLYVESLNKREAEVTTYVGNGIAIPHGKSPSVNEAMVMYAKLGRPLQWQDGSEESLVDMVFMLGIPDKNTENLHLKILSKLSRKLMNEAFTNNLRCANSQEEVMGILSTIV